MIFTQLDFLIARAFEEAAMRGKHVIDHKSCKVCGIQFVPKKKTVVVCSRSCAGRMSQAEINFRTHGMSKLPEYKLWKGIKSRTLNKNNPKYCKYGAKGVSICDRWKDDFPAFYKDMGPRPSKQHSIERINNNVGYEPGNCIWALAKVQANNTSKNKTYSLNGLTLTVAQWADRTGISYTALYYRLTIGGYSIAEAIAQKTLPKNRWKNVQKETRDCAG
jgi:predicted nucleic acid-binding Zn ribbon protein